MSRRLLFLLVAFALPQAAWAVPAFARQYGTSCQTCHVAFPKNTPFGEAFRRNGYRFPGGRDEDFRKQEPQKLAQQAPVRQVAGRFASATRRFPPAFLLS